MGKKIALVLVGVIILLGGVGFYCTPYLAFHNMRIAAENKDTETLNSYVDFPLLKESLKANLNDKIAGKTGSNKDVDQMEQMGAALAAAFFNPMIDALITPENLAMMVRGYMPDRKKSRRTAEKTSKDSSKKKSSKKDSATAVSTYYDNFNSFVVAFKKKKSDEDQVHLIFRRSGLIAWKLSAMKLPL